MKVRILTIGLALSMVSIYFVASYFIGRMKKLKINPASWESADIIEAVENYDLNGVWFDKSQNFLDTIQNFHHKNGTAHVQFVVERMEFSGFQLVNLTLSNRTGYWVEIKLNDGFSALQNKFLFKLKLPSLNQTSTEVKVQRKRIGNFEVKAEDCLLNIKLTIAKDRARKTKNLEDLGFNFYVTSKDPTCEMDLHINFRYNNTTSNQNVYKFLVFGFLLGLYELILLIFTTCHIEANDNVCKNQGVIFWTSIGMFSCLFCFINISGSTENTEKLSLFFVNSMINFINFAIVVLKILHRIGKVQLNTLINTYVK